MTTLPRPRLACTDLVLGEVSALARSLERGHHDVLAADLRACLFAASSAEVFAGLNLELTRLRETSAAVQLRLRDTVDQLLATVELAVGAADPQQVALYTAVRDLVDLLHEDGRQPWANRLEATSRTEGQAEAVALLLEEFAGDTAISPGIAARLEGARARLRRAGERALDCLPVALRAPMVQTPA